MEVSASSNLQLTFNSAEEGRAGVRGGEDMLVVFHYHGSSGSQLGRNDSEARLLGQEQWDVSVANITITVFASLIIFCTLVGNLLVIAAVIKERRLRKVSNSFVINLAVSDILVGTLVTPIALAYQLYGKWIFSKGLCDFWISVDVTCCTASITNLCVISYDRYNAITEPLRYARKRTLKRALFLIFIVWVYSVCIAVPPFFGWRTKEDGLNSKECKISRDIGYTFYSTVGAFYLPLLFMLFAYICIYRETSKQTRQWKRGPGSSKMISERDSEQEAMNIRMLALANENESTVGPAAAQPGSPPLGTGDAVGGGSIRRGSGSGAFLRGSSLLVRHPIPCDSAIVEVDESTRKEGSSSSGSSTNNPGPSTFQATVVSHIPPRYGQNGQEQQGDSSEENTRARGRKYPPFPRKLIRQISNLPSSDSSTTTSSSTSTNTTSSSDLPPDQSFYDRRRSSALIRQPTLPSTCEGKESLSRTMSTSTSGGGDRSKPPLEVRKSVTFLTPPSNTTADGSSGGAEDKDVSPSDPSEYAVVNLLSQAVANSSAKANNNGRKKRRKRISVSQEKRAAKTLSIVMGCFIVCWLPFFVVALMEPLCKNCHFPEALIGVVLWMGYCNSALNPIIYTFFNKDFRFAFKKMLACSRRRSVML